jgi:hypothetical protein
MIDVRAGVASITGFILLAGCGSSANGPVPTPIAAKPDVIITFDEARHTCVVTLSSESQGSAVPCEEVVPFVKEQLRLPSGSIYDIRAVSKVDEAEMAKVGASFKSAGYRFIGGTQ